MSNEMTPEQTTSADEARDDETPVNEVDTAATEAPASEAADAGEDDAPAVEEAADATTTDAPAVEEARSETEEAPGDDAADESADADSATEAATSGSGRRALLEREGEVAADFLETLLDICDLDGDLDVDIDGDRAAVAIVDSDEGRVPRRLVGSDGQVLEALQELTRLAVQSETGDRSRLMLDVAGHRAERRSTLVALAKEAIEEVRSSGERKSLTPMTAFERKVVHDEVLAAGLVSESEGSEPRRFVVISPA